MKTKNKYIFPVELAAKAKIASSKSPAHVGKLRHAIDFYVREGTSVLAALDGTVIDIKQDSSIGGKSKAFDKFGNYIEIKHKNKEYSIYEHIKKNGAIVQVGEKVKTRQVIGYSGKTGWIANLGPHLHFDIHKYLGKSKTNYRTLQIRWKKNMPIVRTLPARD